MLQTAKDTKFRPRYVCFDGWYAGLANLKAVRGHEWHFLTRLKHNRQVNTGVDGPTTRATSPLRTETSPPRGGAST